MSAKTMPQRKPRFSEAIKTKGYQSLIYNTLGDPNRAQRFIASITSAVAVNGQLQECDAGSILAGALLGESLGLQPSPQLGQYYLVPFDCKVKGPDGKALYKTDENGNKLKDAKGHWIAVTEKKAQFVLGYAMYGMTQKEICEQIQVPERTFRRWCAQDPRIKQAVSSGGDVAVAAVANA